MSFLRQLLKFEVWFIFNIVMTKTHCLKLRALSLQAFTFDGPFNLNFASLYKTKQNKKKRPKNHTNKNTFNRIQSVNISGSHWISQ